MAQHVIKGTAAPAIAPTALAQNFIDETNKKAYIGVGTSDPSDFIDVSGSGGGGVAGVYGDFTVDHTYTIDPTDTTAILDPANGGIQEFDFTANGTDQTIQITVNDPATTPTRMLLLMRMATITGSSTTTFSFKKSNGQSILLSRGNETISGEALSTNVSTGRNILMNFELLAVGNIGWVGNALHTATIFS